jgi:hypothetical protein
MNDVDRLLERALQEPLLHAPPGFAERVCAALPGRVLVPSGVRVRRWLRTAVLTAAGALGAAQTAAFVWGLWVAGSVALG